MGELNKNFGENKKKKIIFGSSYDLNQKLLFDKQLNSEVFFGLPHYLIDKNGDINQILDVDFNSKFTGTISDEDSITILLEHEGYLKYNGSENKFYTAFDTIYNKTNIVEQIWRDKCHWVTYSEIQLRALKKLCKDLCVEHKITPKVVTSSIKNKDFQSSTILGRSNVSMFFLDPNPTFNYGILKDLENEL